MRDIHQFIQQIEAGASRVGVRLDLLCRKATGNPRWLDRFHGRVALLESDMERVLAFINAEAGETNTPSSAPIVSIPQGNKRGTRNKKSVKNGGIA